MGMRTLIGLGFLIMLVAITGCASTKPASHTAAPDVNTPWAFVNGSAEGYSVKLESASPVPGTRVAVGQTVHFSVVVSYALSIADTGAIALVTQDETNKNLRPGNLPLQPVARGKGTVTMTEDFIVPAGSREIRIFVPLVPNGMTRTDGELLLRYPIAVAK